MRSFNSEGNILKLILESFRIKLAHVFDPYLAVRNSDIEPLPHQISAVYHEMLPRMPLRYVLADDPGAGKTIMTGLFVKELVMRGDIKRCLIVSPGSLAEQWQDELSQKFGLSFDILNNDMAESAHIFTESHFLIARLDKLARDESLQQRLKVTEWDLIVVDEAHKMSASVFSKEISYTKRFRLGQLLSKIARNFLLLTATPHNGKNDDFQLFMSLIDSDRFGLSHSPGNNDVSDVMRRLVKEDLLNFNGTPLFPERIAYTVSYNLSHSEERLYNEVTEYIRNEFNRADNLSGKRKNTVGFALTILQRRLASSPEAIYQSLRKRIDRLEERLKEEKSGRLSHKVYSIDDDFDPDEFTPGEFEAAEENISAFASASTTIRELEAEIDTLKRLAIMAGNVRDSGDDVKWRELSSLIQDNSRMFDPNGQREKLIIFTEHKDTLHYLAGKIRSLIGNNESVITIHGGMSRNDRRKAEHVFRNDSQAVIMIATDAAGEGINLQRAHLMVNYDLPWNPNRLEQRFGRIHRIGQKEVCHLWNLVAKNTREGSVFQRLFQKLENAREALGGKVFDILGKLTFDNTPLRDLLIKAIRYGNDPAVRNKLNQSVDNSLDREKVLTLIEKHALTRDIMDASTAREINSDIQRTEARKIQPYFVESFFIEAFRNLGGRIFARENGRYEILFVPHSLRRKGNILPEYKRVCFGRNFCSVPGKLPAVLIAPGHPLLEAVIESVQEKYSDALKAGAVFIDENDSAKEPRLLFAILDSIKDSSDRIIYRNLHFAEIYADGKSSNAGFAPYLDYRAASTQEQSAILQHLKGHAILSGRIERKAEIYAQESIAPQHSAKIIARKLAALAKTEEAVTTRLTAEINYWGFLAIDLKQQEDAGKFSKNITSQNARKRSDEFLERLHERLAEIQREKNISSLPPEIISAALVIPQGLLQDLPGKIADDDSISGDKKRIELAAMNAVIQAEKEQGHSPRDVSAQKCGYDIESSIPPGGNDSQESLRLIEVKGRAKGASSVTVSANEILTCLNKKDSFILALVEVDGDSASHIVYLRRPFTNHPDFSTISINFDIKRLIRDSQLVYEKRIS